MQRSIVIGGSIAGLLTARVLSDYCDEVIILERDQFPQVPASRGGVPQDRHGHLLMARGQQIIEKYLPQIREDFQANLPRIRWGLDTRVLMSGGWMKIADTGIRTYACSRLWLEHTMRQHILQLPNVTARENARVTDLTLDASGAAITGLCYAQGKQQHSLTADLVVDASGKRSKAADWLAALGFGTVETTTIDPYMGYATRWYQKPQHFSEDWKLYISYAQPENGLYRSGAIVEVEDNKWLVILGGTNKDYAPTDEAGYAEFLQSLAAPKLYDYLRMADPISPIYGYRQTANHWRHYEKMPRFPQRFIALGDAVCSFNPVYAQGMSVSALEADLLNDCLQRADGDAAGDFAKQFQAHLATVVSEAWNLSAVADALLPEATGSKPNRLVLWGQRYITKLTELMPYDADVSGRFLSIMHMLGSPTSLFHPQVLWRFARFQMLRPQAPVEEVDLLTQPGKI